MLLSLLPQSDSTIYVHTIEDNPRHFDRLFNLCGELQPVLDDALTFTIDFSRCGFLAHSGVAFLGGLVHLIQSRGGCVQFDWETLAPKIRTNLAQNGFLHQFGHSYGPWSGNSIPYRSDLKLDSKALGSYLRDDWLGKGCINLSSGLQDAIMGLALEIYLNAFDHAQSEIGVFSCGQHYPSRGELQLTAIDFGIGIPTNVRSLATNAHFSTKQALAWALQNGTSTRKGESACRGTGLSWLQDFIRRNHGSLTIFSNDGCVAIDDNGVKYECRQSSFPGTLVNIMFKCDEAYYCLASERARLTESLF